LSVRADGDLSKGAALVWLDRSYLHDIAKHTAQSLEDLDRSNTIAEWPRVNNE
jgi:hypothetical protein